MEKRNIQQDVLDLLEEYAKLPYEKHGYINPHLLSMLLDVVNFNGSTLETSYNLSNWIDGMWGQ